MNMVGKKIGKYELTELLGQGGMAQVYKAVQPTIERVVAVKILHSHLSHSDDFVARFKREARSLGLLHHPHIMRVIDFDIEGDVYYMVVDHIPGKTLRQYLDERGLLPYGEVLYLVAQLADALEYAHQHGMIHRDIKPANVMFQDDRRCTHAILTDFGIGRIVNDATVTATGSIIGTPAYMSPEAVMGKPLDGRADIYSLGVILYEMLTGSVPYTGDTPISVIMKQVHDPLPSPRSLRADLPDTLVGLVEKALAKDPKDRFQTAQEFLDAIRGVQATLETAPAPRPITTARLSSDDDEENPPETVSMPAPKAPDPVPAQPDPAAHPSQRPRWLLPVAGVVGVVLVGLLAWAFQTGGEASDPPDGTRVAATGGASDGATVALSITATFAVTTASATESSATSTPLTDAFPETVAPTATQGAEVPAVASPSPRASGAAPIEATSAVSSGHNGLLRFAEQESSPTRFALHMERVVQPPAGTHYEWWLQEHKDSRLLNLGSLELRDGHILKSGSLDTFPAMLEGSVLITSEPDGVDNTSATTYSGSLAFVGRLPAAYANEMRPLFGGGNSDEDGVGLLNGAHEQALVAAQHTQFSQESLAAGNLAEAKNHLEHVINILDGEEGEHFGDLNLDGQTQNPGDGFGVRAYLEESQSHLQQAQDYIVLTPYRGYHTEQALDVASGGLDTVEQAISSALTMLATDTAEEAQPHIDEVQRHTSRLVSAEGGQQQYIGTARKHALALVAFPIGASDPVLPSPDSIASSASGRVGTLQLSSNTDNAQARGGDYLLQVERMEPLPAGSHYDAWLEGTDALGEAIFLFLGQLDMTGPYGVLAGSQDVPLLSTYQQVVVSIETTESNEVPSPAVVLEGSLTSAISEQVLAMLSEREGNQGVVIAAEEQTDTAIQHTGFARDGFESNDLQEAQKHVEHVVNILDGEEGEHFGDLNGDGQAQNPGDGVGVRGHMLRLIEQVEQIEQQTDLSGDQQFAARQVVETSHNRLATVDAAIAEAHKILASDTLEEAQPFIAELTGLLDSLRNGHDADQNGVVDPLRGEGGVSHTYDMVLALNEVPVFPRSEEVGA